MTTDFWIRLVEVVVVSLAAICSAFFWMRVQRGEPVSASAHWGGLGGGTGGWRVTTALVALLAALFLWALAAALAIYSAQMQRADAAAKLEHDRADEATKINYKREDAKIALDEQHRTEERADREAERIRAEAAAVSAAAASASQAAAKAPVLKPNVRPPAAAPASSP